MTKIKLVQTLDFQSDWGGFANTTPPFWVNKTWDEDTNVSNYNMRFRGPSDTKEELNVISLVEGKFVYFFFIFSNK